MTVVDVDVRLAAHGVDRAVARGDRGERGLVRAQPHLVAPVDALLVRALLVDERAPGRRRSRPPGRRTAAASARSAPGSQAALASVKASSSPRAARDRGVLRADLAAAGQLEHEVGAGRAGAARPSRPRPARRRRRRRRRPASRSRGQSSASAFATFAGDHVLLGVRGDDQRHGAALPASPAGAPAGRRARAAAARGTGRSPPASRRARRWSSRRSRARAGGARRSMVAGAS